MEIRTRPRDARAAMALATTLLVTFSVACTTPAQSTAPDPMNGTYRIEKDTVTLANGRAEREAAPGSATKVVTTVADQRIGDVDGDGRNDAVVILIHQPGGSGTFYYVAALLNVPGGVTATPAVLLGDRIKVSALKLDGQRIVVDLLERGAGQPFTASPTVASTKRFVIERGVLVSQ